MKRSATTTKNADAVLDSLVGSDRLSMLTSFSAFETDQVLMTSKTRETNQKGPELGAPAATYATAKEALANSSKRSEALRHEQKTGRGRVPFSQRVPLQR